MPQNTRRAFSRNRVKGPKLPGAYAPGFHQKQGKRPKIFRRYAPQMVQKGPTFYGATRRETHHQISPHILNMCLQPFFPAWQAGHPAD